MYHLNVGMTLMLGMYQIDLMRWRVTQLMSKMVSSHSAVSPLPTNFLWTMRANSRLSHPFFPGTWSLLTLMAPLMCQWEMIQAARVRMQMMQMMEMTLSLIKWALLLRLYLYINSFVF